MFQRYFDSNLISCYILLHWQQEKSKQIHAWALEISIMSLHLIFQGKRRGFSSEHQHTCSSQEQMGISVVCLCLSSRVSWQGKFSLEDKSSEFWNRHVPPLTTSTRADLVGGFVIGSGPVLSEGCYCGAGLGAQAPCLTTGTTALSTPRSWLGVFVPESTL